MFVNQRFKDIQDYLKEHKKASVDELSRFLFVSPATVRRDLLEMQKIGMIARTHGGALYIEKSDEVSIIVRLSENSAQKELTAEIALRHLPEFQTVFIDNSSTCLTLAEKMDLSHKTVITNGLQVALSLSKKEDVNIIMPAGEVKYKTNAGSCSLTCHLLRSFNVDLMLSSCAGFDEQGSYEFSVDTSQLKQVALEQARQKILVVDHNKLFKTAPYRTCTLNLYDAIITDAPTKDIAPLRDAGHNVINGEN
jgi:DeoR/GlpR family transcriptional regulator of sugar metabolism